MLYFLLIHLVIIGKNSANPVLEKRGQRFSNGKKNNYTTFDNVCLVLDFILFVVDSFFHVQIVINDILSHAEVIAYDCLGTIIHQ